MSTATPRESDSASADAQAQQRYRDRLAELGAEATRLDRRDRRLSTARGLTFLLTAGPALYGAFQPWTWQWAVVGVVAAAFVLFVVLHALLSTKQFDNQRRRALCEQGLARMSGSYRAPDDQERLRGERFRQAEHDYGWDLDLFGAGSLFELLCTCRTWPGESTLANWLMTPARRDELERRQGAVRELARAPSLREELNLEGFKAAGTETDTGPLEIWAQQRSEPTVHRPALLLPSALLVLVTIALLVLDGATGAPWARAWIGTSSLQIVLYVVLRRRLETVIGPVCERHAPLGRFRAIIALLELQRFEEPLLQDEQAALQGGDGVKASTEMGRLERIVSLAALRYHPLVHVPANALLLWDLWCAWALDRWRRRTGPQVTRWLGAVGSLEALGSLATFADEHPGFAWPRFVDGPARFEANGLGHPLLPPDRRVANDVTLGERPAALLITGSNMSGKSTLLRAIGVNAVLAHAGAPVCAGELRTTELRVRTSMRVDDSLEQGVSRFFNELHRIKRVLDGAESEGPPVLFLLDEMLHGTNSRERNIGARAIVHRLIEVGAIGALCTHDLGLVSLEERSEGRVRNVHFTDHVADGQMAFDYRLKTGPVATPNALRLMRQVGIQVDLDEPPAPTPAARTDG